MYNVIHIPSEDKYILFGERGSINFFGDDVRGMTDQEFQFFIDFLFFVGKFES